MRILLHLAAIVALTGAATTHAQITNPDALVAHPPRNPAQHKSIQPNDDLQWLWQFTHPSPDGQADALRLDGRFQSLLTREFNQPQSMWGDNPAHPPPLATIIPLFLTQFGDVTSSQNRYIAVDGCVPSFCPAAGLLWIDLGTPHPLMVFAAVKWDPQSNTPEEPSADYNLWLYPNRQLSPNALPFALNEAIAQWNARLAAAHRIVPHIARALLIEPSGLPFAVNPQLTGADTLASQPSTINAP